MNNDIKLTAVEFPSTVRELIKDSQLTDCSFSPIAKVYHISGKMNAYLKIANAGKLGREAGMSSFLHRHGLAPEVIAYIKDENYEYMLTDTLDGFNGIHKLHINEPKKLAAVFGESLALIHSVDRAECPFKDRSSEMIQSVINNLSGNIMDADIIPEGRKEAIKRFHELSSALVNDAVIHGDYCLPNIILNDFKLSGFVDLSYGGVGDRHFDIFWGLYTLKYNLKTTKYNKIFLDAYGCKNIDKERLECCRIISGLTE